jgi:hypothetical protein
MDYIGRNGLILDPNTKEFFWGNERKWNQGYITGKEGY